MITYRILTEADFDDEQLISGLYTLVFVNHKLKPPVLRDIVANRRYETLTYAAIDSEKNAIVACGAVCCYQSFDGTNTGLMYDVSVRKEYEGQGIGNGLVVYMFQDGKAQGLSWISGPVSPPLQEFYTKAGAVMQPNVAGLDFHYANTFPAIQQPADPAFEFRELVAEDFDGPLGTTIDTAVFATADVAKLKAVLASRLMTDTYVIVDKVNNLLVGHAAISVHWAFSGEPRGLMCDFGTSSQYHGTQLEFSFAMFVRDSSRRKHGLCRLGIVAGPDVAPVCRKFGAAETDAAVMYYLCQ